MKGRVQLVVLSAAMLALSACGKAVPPDKSAYIGEWRAQAMALLVTQDGSVAYKRIKGGVTTSVNAPLRRFEGDNFVVGLPLVSTTFEVSKPPYEEAGRWKMVVDGVELTRVR
jgi:hypothetical protein